MTYTIVRADYLVHPDTWYCVIKSTNDGFMYKTDWTHAISSTITTQYTEIPYSTIQQLFDAMVKYATHILATTNDLSTLHESNPELFI